MNNVYDKTFSFAIRIVECYKFLAFKRKEYVLSKQLLRSGTSIGANTAEAYGGISDADFCFKLSLAYKESLETKYWIKLLEASNYLKPEVSSSLHKDADEISRILYTIIKRTKIRNLKT